MSFWPNDAVQVETYHVSDLESWFQGELVTDLSAMSPLLSVWVEYTSSFDPSRGQETGVEGGPKDLRRDDISSNR